MDAESESATTCTSAEAPAPLSRKCAQILDGARAVILARGFEGASVDEIAREAGISKATMYRYFPDKGALFEAVMRRDCALQGAAMLDVPLDGRPIRETLAQIAVQHIRFVVSPMAQDVFRTAVAESGRFPEIGRAFYAAAVDGARASLAPALTEAVARGELAIDDVDLAAQRFFALCKADMFLKRLLGVVDGFTDAEIVSRARDTTDAFMRMYAPI